MNSTIGADDGDTGARTPNTGGTPSNLADILRKVNAMLTQADHPNTGPAEAEAFRGKAEALMYRYRIDEAMLSSAERAQMGVNVQWLSFDVCEAASEFKYSYIDMMQACITHLDVRADFIRTVGRKTGDVVMVTEADRGEERWMTIDVVGYESDLLFIQSLFSAARLAFSKALEPKYDPALSDQVNAYLMRSAGMEGWRIAQAIYGKTDKALRPKVRKLFAAEAKKRGEDPAVLLGRGSNMKLFRESYAQGFVNEFRHRLYMMRASRGAVSTGIELAGRKEAIDEAFYAKFPERRPKPVPAIGEANIKVCRKCQNAKSGYCNEHRWMRPSMARSRVRYANSEGIARGQRAARSVDLGITGREVGS